MKKILLVVLATCALWGQNTYALEAEGIIQELKHCKQALIGRPCCLK